MNSVTGWSSGTYIRVTRLSPCWHRISVPSSSIINPLEPDSPPLSAASVNPEGSRYISTPFSSVHLYTLFSGTSENRRKLYSSTQTGPSDQLNPSPKIGRAHV